MVSGFQHTVFLCHNSREKDEVARIRSQLRERGIYGWLDKYDFEPMRPWADQLEEILPQIQAAAIFIGASGVGPWANIEMREFLVEFGNRNLRMGLVLLPGCPDDLSQLNPPVPRFLKSFHWIDFRVSDPNPLDQLIWGITGQKPQGLNTSPTNPFETDASANLSVPIEEPTDLTAEDWFDRAFAKDQQGDKHGAIADFTQAIQLKPDFATAYNNRGIARKALGDKQGAIADFTQAIQLKPDFALAYYNQGNIRSDLGDKQGAIADFTQAIQLKPDFALAYNNRGNIYSDLGDKQGAIEDYTQAIQLQPNFVGAYNNRGSARSDLGDKQRAIEDFTHAIRLQPDYADAYNNRGLARSGLGDKQGAIKDYTQAIQIQLHLAKVYNNRGVAHSDLGNKQGAISDYTKAIQLQPDYANAYYNRGAARDDLGDKQGAIADYQQAANLYLQQSDMSNYQDALNQIKKLNSPGFFKRLFG